MIGELISRNPARHVSISKKRSEKSRGVYCITEAFKKALREHDLPHLRFHNLRHSTASILYDKGWSLKDIQIWLGHADISAGNVFSIGILLSV